LKTRSRTSALPSSSTPATVRTFRSTAPWSSAIRPPANHHIIDLNTNVGQDATDGLDLAVRYALPTDYGRFGFIFDGTWLHKFQRTLADGSVLSGRGTYDLGTGSIGGIYPAFKFNTGVAWSLAGSGRA